MSYTNTITISLLAGILGFIPLQPAYAAQDQAVSDPGTLYREECASCHMAYPPMLLPARSWQKIMGTLDNHFGDNAALEKETVRILTGYLELHSADSGSSKRGRKILRRLDPDSTPLRISTLPYIQHEHDELPARLVSGNPQVKSLSNCVACHTQAEQGRFDDDNVRIPGYGRWDD